jgi:trk system potassium uptake protein TrkA
MMASSKQFVVIGLGSFGTALARRLKKDGCRVTGLDCRAERVEALKNDLYEAVIGDATERDTLEHVALKDANAVVIGMGEDITSSLLAALHVKELGARQIIVKGVTEEHAKLLNCLGVNRVVFPEIEAAEELADRMAWPNVIDFLPIDPDYSIVEVAVPDSYVGKTLQQVNVRRKYGVWVVGIKDALSGSLELFPDGEFTFGADQILLAIGKQGELNRLREIQ